MAANVYECMFLLDTNKVAGDEMGAVKLIHGLIERNHAEVLATRRWQDSNKLSYPVKGHKRGLYVLIFFRSEGKNLLDMERDLGLHEPILRYLLLKIEPKFVPKMLEVGNDGGPLFLLTVNEPPLEDTLSGGDDDRRNRRGPRREFADKEG